MPEAWFLKYHSDNIFYTLYAADQNSFALDHREVGVHNKVQSTQNDQTISLWKSSWDLDRLPDQPSMLDLWLLDNNQYAGYQARRLWARKIKLIILCYIYNQDDLNELTEVNVKTLDTTEMLFVVSNENIYKEVINLGVSPENVGIQRSSKTFQTREAFIVENLKSLSQMAEPKLVLPVSMINSSRDKLDFQSKSTNIRVGRLNSDQIHPRIDLMYLDGSLAAFKAMEKLNNDMKSEVILDSSLRFNFLAKLTNEKMVEHTASWSWFRVE